MDNCALMHQRLKTMQSQNNICFICQNLTLSLTFDLFKYRTLGWYRLLKI